MIANCCADAIADDADWVSARRLVVEGGAIDGCISAASNLVEAPSDELRVARLTGENGSVLFAIGADGSKRGHSGIAFKSILDDGLCI